MAAYKEEFPIGSAVKIIDSTELEEFARSWNYHHPLQREQMKCARRAAEVEDVGFYHGGDVLYTQSGLPGYWHEQCLKAVRKS